jgi:adenylosuccinate lyase
MITNISPLDGRYSDKIQPLTNYLSEYALIKYRLVVEIRWLQHLSNNSKIKELPKFSQAMNIYLEDLIINFTTQEAKKIKTIERCTNHDVKAVEYYLKTKLSQHSDLKQYLEFVHFCATSEDINNVSYSLMLQDASRQELIPSVQKVIMVLQKLAKKTQHIAMLGRTHGQAATPTTLGKEIQNFIYRLNKQLKQLKSLKLTAKFNGATGNYNAHHFTYPAINWPQECEKFIKSFKLEFNSHTTQIEPHDTIAECCHIHIRINNILTDLAKDIWFYIALNYFKQKAVKTETGSSTMPHKINPIDFENAEGNLELANSLLNHLANKLPISRLQRDLSDSTTLRNLGSAFAYGYLAQLSLIKGLKKLIPNESAITKDIADRFELLAEPVQSVMRKYGIKKSYEKLKDFTRGRKITQESLHRFIDSLSIPLSEKNKLKELTPATYIGYAISLNRP